MAENLVLVHRSEGNDPVHVRRAARDGPGLVEKHRGNGSEALENAGALHDHSRLRRPREPSDERDRCREDERARRCDDHHRQPTHGIPARRPRQTRDRERKREEDRRIPVGEPRERRTVALRRPHELHDRRVRALGCRTRDAGVEGVPGVRRPGPHLAARGNRHRQGLARERRLVDNGNRALDGRVRRDDLPGPNDDEVAGHELLDRHLLDSVRAMAVRDTRCALDEEAKLASRPTGRPRLERRTTGHHQRDDRSGQLFSEDERPGDRDERDRIDADVAVQEAAHRVDGQRDQHDRRTDTPSRVRPAGLADEPQDAARQNGGERHDREQPLLHAAILPAASRAVGRLHPALHPLTNGSLERGTEESPHDEDDHRHGRAADRPSARSRGADRSRVLERRGGAVPRDLRPHRTGTQRRAPREARRSAAAADPRSVSPAHR